MSSTRRCLCRLDRVRNGFLAIEKPTAVGEKIVRPRRFSAGRRRLYKQPANRFGSSIYRSIEPTVLYVTPPKPYRYDITATCNDRSAMTCTTCTTCTAQAAAPRPASRPPSCVVVGGRPIVARRSDVVSIRIRWRNVENSRLYRTIYRTAESVCRFFVQTSPTGRKPSRSDDFFADGGRFSNCQKSISHTIETTKTTSCTRHSHLHDALSDLRIGRR
jgi:hypothetical protein